MIEHSLVRATLLTEIVRLIAERLHTSEEEALDCFYNSATGANFADDATGLYGQSPLFISGLFFEEKSFSHCANSKNSLPSTSVGTALPKSRPPSKKKKNP